MARRRPEAVVIITSAANPRLTQLRETLRQGEGDPLGRVPIEGPKLLDEAIRSSLQVEEIFVAQSRQQESAVQELLARAQGATVTVVADRLLSSLGGTETPQGLVALAKLPQFSLEAAMQGDPLLLVAFELQDPGNLGTLLRSAEAFGASAVLLSRGSVNPRNPKVIRASAGSIFRVPCLDGFDISGLLDIFTQSHMRLLAAVPKAGTDFRKVSYAGSLALLVGNEARGLDEEILRRVGTRLRIPMKQSVESLNAAIATSIILCEAARQRGTTVNLE